MRKRRLAMESLEPKCLLAALVVQGTAGADAFEFSSDSIRVNGVERGYDATENPVVILDGLASSATETVSLTGSLSQTGEVATAAKRIQTGILGDARYSAPQASGTVSNGLQPSIISIATASNVSGGSTFVAGDTYDYKVVWADDYGLGTPTPTESRPSEVFSQTVAANGDSIDLSSLPTTPPTDAFTHLRVYRRKSTDTEFNYVGQVDVSTGNTFSDTVDDVTAAANPVLQETDLSGNYVYYVTYVASDGKESRPGPLAGPINVTNGRVTLDNLPQADVATTEWRTRRIYRSLATDSSTFHLVGEIPNMDADQFFVDNLSDAAISTNPTTDLDGPKILPSTLLVDVLSRDGSVYSQVFQEGILEFTGKKGGRSLEEKELTVGVNTTVQDLIDFMDASLGIQSASADPVSPVPGDMGTGSNIPSGGQVSSDGRIILTGNNGPSNAIQLDLPGLAFTQLQPASGEGTATDLMVFDDQGNARQILLTTALEARDGATTAYRWFAHSSTGLVTFDVSGNVVATTNMTVTVSETFSFDLDFSSVGVGESDLQAAQDTIILHGTSGNETVTIQPGSAIFTGSTFEVQVEHIPGIKVVGGGGIDVAELVDSPLDDHLVAAPDGVTLSGPAFRSRVEGFRVVHGYARSGGIDVADLFDGEGDDRFMATPTYGRLVLDTQSLSSQGVLRAKFFDYVHAYAKQGGRDVAYMSDSAGDDMFVRTDTIGKLRGDGFQNRAKFFEAVSGSASTGNDVARLITSGDSHLLATGTRATLSGAVSAAIYRFDRVWAMSTDASNTRDLEAIAYQLWMYGPWSRA